MSETNSIKLRSSCIQNVPFEVYGKDFSFIVNCEEFKTNKIISDLISPRISNIHSTDPTFDRFIINTKVRGNFSNVLQLYNFEKKQYPKKELGFLIEVSEILENEFIESDEVKNNDEITLDNVFDKIKEHSKHSNFYHSQITAEIEFISSHIYEFLETKEESLMKMTIEELYSIFTNDQLQLNNEDQLLKLINKLYISDEKYSILYETVLFENVSKETICDFIKIFDYENLTHDTWERLSVRLCNEMKNDNESKNLFNQQRYKEEKKISKGITFNKENEYDGIINYLRKKSNGQIENEINITASSICNSSEDYQPRVVTLFDDHNKFFYTNSESNSFLCFDFKEHRIIPTAYSIRSFNCGPNYEHPKSWVVECSNDNKTWETVDEENDCSYLNGKNYSHTFTMNHQKTNEFQYIRIRLTGPTWCNNNQLVLDSFEVYGQFN